MSPSVISLFQPWLCSCPCPIQAVECMANHCAVNLVFYLVLGVCSSSTVCQLAGREVKTSARHTFPDYSLY